MAQEQPPISKTPTHNELLKISQEAHDYLRGCINELEPTKDLPGMVSLGMATKILKLYHTLFMASGNGGGEAVPMLSRAIYEYTLSLAYMLVKDQEDPGIYEKFRLSALIRNHATINAMRKSSAKDRSTTRTAIQSAESMLRLEGYDFTKRLPNLPKTWHPTKSYMAMAHELGEDFQYFYDTFYATTSVFVHPNWLDIKRQLLFRNDGAARAKLRDGERSILPLAIATCTVLELTKIYRTKFIQLGADVEMQSKIINQIISTHFSLHN